MKLSIITRSQVLYTVAAVLALASVQPLAAIADTKTPAKDDKAAASASNSTAKVNKPTSKSDKSTSADNKSAPKATKPTVIDSKNSLVNLNKASEAELQTVAGIGPTYARNIIAHRPYKSIDDLSKAGIPAATISKIRPLVTTSDAAASQIGTKPVAPEKSPALVDINKGTAAQLQEVPGIGEAYAKKIVDNRPYKSVDDLSKAGIPAATIEKIKSRVTVGGTIAAVAPPAKGMVWVNLESKMYHKESSRWYGKTKSGKYMTESDAEKAGYKPAKK